MNNPYPTPLQQRIALMLKQNPSLRERLNPKPEPEVKLERNDLIVFVAARTIETARDAKMYISAVYRSLYLGEETAAVTINLPLNNNVGENFNRARDWFLRNVNPTYKVRVSSNFSFDAPIGFTDFEAFYVSDDRNPAAGQLESYIRSL